MENLKEKEEVIKFAQKLNTTNLSPLRSGNVSLRYLATAEDFMYRFFSS